MTRALLIALVAIAAFAGWQTLRLAWAENDRAALTNKIAAYEEAARMLGGANKIADRVRVEQRARADTLAATLEAIATGDFTDADAPLDPDLRNLLERLLAGDNDIRAPADPR